MLDYIVFAGVSLVFFIYLSRYILIKKKLAAVVDKPLEIEYKASLDIDSIFAKKGYLLPKKANFPDKTFPNNMIFWGILRSTLDNTWHARRIALDLDKFIGGNGFYNEFINRYSSKTIDFARKHFDDEEGAFAPNADSWACLYGIISALMVFSQFHPSSNIFDPMKKNFVENFIGKERVCKILSFIDRCKSKSSFGVGYKETPYEDTPTVVSTFYALSILWNLEEELEDIGEIKRFLKNCYQIKSLGSQRLFGSNNHPKDDRPPCSSMTRLSIRAFIILSAFQNGNKLEKDASSRYNNFDLFIDQFELEEEKLKDIFELYKSCKESDGSFSAYPYDTPEEKKISDIYHTHSAASVVYYAQKWIDKLKEYKISDFIELNNLCEYLKSCKADSYGYDLSKNGHKYSNVFGTRYALDLMSCLKEIFGEKYQLEVSELKKVGKFLDMCFDKNNGAFYAFPVYSQI